MWELRKTLSTVVVAIWLVLTCGGNILLFDTWIFGTGWGKVLENAFVFWFYELWALIIIALLILFWKRPSPNTWSIINNITPIERTKSSSIETIDLMSTLSQVDISVVESITFLPHNWTGFTIKTPNIKKLAIHIIKSIGKNTFDPEELRKPFDHVVKHIQSNLSKRDFDLVTGKIDEFVKSGGEVKVNKI